jgi:hypothetical protein
MLLLSNIDISDLDFTKNAQKKRMVSAFALRHWQRIAW